MSLSQKHTGKVLVPWFNVAEWQTVYNLIFSAASNWTKALDILKMWKIRTPLLSAGVEGSLIILEALLVNTSHSTSYETTHIFATSLVRFLNLCAANSDKQGTFYKTARKNDLPKWLVSIRHDIAHGHKLPSQSMLELSLKFCLKWLKEKYWDVQYNSMSDFVANPKLSTILEDSLYVHLNQHAMNENDKNLRKCVSRLLIGGFIHNTSEEIVEKADNLLKEAIKNNKDESAEKICSLLLDDYTIFKVDCEINDTGAKRVAPEFLDNWNNLINIMYECEIMPHFGHRLLQFICDEENDVLCREIASLWIKAIFRGLNNKEKNYNSKSDLSFNTVNDSMKMKRFVHEILEQPNLFTTNFHKEVLEYNNAPSEFIKDSLQLLTAFNAPQIVENKEILTVEDLNFNVEDFEQPDNEEPPKKCSRWTLIEDTDPYSNLPLGVLPHQHRGRNPVLTI